MGWYFQYRLWKYLIIIWKMAGIWREQCVNDVFVRHLHTIKTILQSHTKYLQSFVFGILIYDSGSQTHYNRMPDCTEQHFISCLRSMSALSMGRLHDNVLHKKLEFYRSYDFKAIAMPIKPKQLIELHQYARLELNFEMPVQYASGFELGLWSQITTRVQMKCLDLSL